MTPTRRYFDIPKRLVICDKCNKRVDSREAKIEAQTIICYNCAFAAEPPITNPISRPKRNEPCPCGSLKKYKSCCIKN